MNSLKNFEEILNKCSRCGLCQAVCPIYQLTKNDCTSPKGKCILLNNLIKSEKNPSKETVKYFKTCSNCGKCVDFCPGKIDITKINAEIFKNYIKPSLFTKIFKNIFLTFLIIKENILNIKNPKLYGKIAYIKPYSQKHIPENIKKYNPDIIESLYCDLDFIINNPKLFNILAEKSALKYVGLNYDCFITDNLLCKYEFEAGLKKIKQNIKVIYMP